LGFEFMKSKPAHHGFTLIELLMVTVILAVLAVVGLTSFRQQIYKGRDARRKADISQIQKILEDYYNDKNSYPDRVDYSCGSTAGTVFEGYAKQIPCDPLNNAWYNYFYSTSDEKPTKSWYKLYARLENVKDPIIAKVGCSAGCGPSKNYNYWVASPNMSDVAQQLPGESWWPVIPPEVL
jgi:prepilin-type N-terminal cleavage/methylation domain-containing protein